MNAVNKTAVLLLISANISGCATSMKDKIMRNTLIATTAGAAYGNARDEYKTQHSVMYGASAGLIAALLSVYYYDPDREIESSKKQTKELAKSLDEFSNGTTSHSRYKSANSGPALNNFSALPEKYRNLISPGEWTLMQIDEWEPLDENRLIHKTELLELKPPKLNQ